MSMPGLGLSHEDTAAIRRMRFDAVVHSAAAVDHARP
jgi:thioester reductase-like protein